MIYNKKALLERIKEFNKEHKCRITYSTVTWENFEYMKYDYCSSYNSKKLLFEDIENCMFNLYKVENFGVALEIIGYLEGIIYEQKLFNLDGSEHIVEEIVLEKDVICTENYKMQYEGYLNQQKLQQMFKENIEEHNWLGTEIKLPNSKRRFDFGFIISKPICINNTQYTKKVLVEFDGHRHYTDALQIKIDREKDKLAKEHGYDLIRIPYWVQLTTETLKHYFNINGEVIQKYSHGFIDKNAILPASFCELGLDRFEEEIGNLPVNVKEEISKSLNNNINFYGYEYVMPKGMEYIL